MERGLHCITLGKYGVTVKLPRKSRYVILMFGFAEKFYTIQNKYISGLV
jgi:hypothetical protein